MQRKDFRTDQDFKKDIKYSTYIETILWKEFLTKFSKTVDSYEAINYGTDNSGEFSEKASPNADYKLKYVLNNKSHELKLEIKFAPTKGKLTFKKQNLSSYLKDKANILLFYNSSSESLKKRKDWNAKKQAEIILQKKKYIKWGIIDTESINQILCDYDTINLYYMGNKPCIVVPESDFNKYVTLYSL